MKNGLAIFLLFSVTLLLSACTLWREHPASSKWTDATGGEGLERSFWKEVKDKKWSELEHHIASNYVAVSAQGGRLDKAAAVAQIQQLQLDDYTFGDLQAEMNSDTFVVTYTIAMRRPAFGDRIPADDDGLAKTKRRVDGDCPFRSWAGEQVASRLPCDELARNEFRPQPEIRWPWNPPLAAALAVVVRPQPA
jgi:hypothetical protein